jgi:hypothetical protein
VKKDLKREDRGIQAYEGDLKERSEGARAREGLISVLAKKIDAEATPEG